MNQRALIAAGAALAWGGYSLYRAQRDGVGLGDTLADQASSAATLLDQASFGMFKISNIRLANPGLLDNPNVRAMLAVIRRGEGTEGDAGYRTLYGGGLFSSLTDHPRRTVSRGKWTSSAAGAYQFLESTWDETAGILGLSDFSSKSQDLAAVGRIAARGALGDLLAGRFAQAIKKLAREWASLPGSPYGQPTISLADAEAVYRHAGGSVA